MVYAKYRKTRLQWPVSPLGTFKWRLAYKSFAGYYLYERFMYRQHDIPSTDMIVGPSGRCYSAREIVAQMRAIGIGMLPGYWSEAACDDAYGDMLKVVDDIKGGLLPRVHLDNKHTGHVGWSPASLKSGVYKVQAFHKVSQGARVFAQDASLERLVSLYCGSRAVYQTTASQYTFRADNDPMPWHVDSKTNHAKAFLYLTDVSIDNGPLEYVVGTNVVNLGNLKRAYDIFRTRGNGVDDAEMDRLRTGGYEFRKFCVTKGTVLLVDTRGVHRGSKLNEGTRAILENYYHLWQDAPPGRVYNTGGKRMDADENGKLLPMTVDGSRRGGSRTSSGQPAIGPSA